MLFVLALFLNDDVVKRRDEKAKNSRWQNFQTAFTNEILIFELSKVLAANMSRKVLKYSRFKPAERGTKLNLIIWNLLKSDLAGSEFISIDSHYVILLDFVKP